MNTKNQENLLHNEVNRKKTNIKNFDFCNYLTAFDLGSKSKNVKRNEKSSRKDSRTKSKI